MNTRRLTPALIALNAVLALVLAALWLAPGAPVRWRTWQAPAPQSPSLADARTARLTPNPALQRTFPIITARPLFSANRKPHATASDAASAPPSDIDQAQIYGLVDGSSTQGVLLEREGQSQFVRIGEHVGDWTLQSINGRDALFTKTNGERRTVTLPDSLAGAGGTPADGASAPAGGGASSATNATFRPAAPASAPATAPSARVTVPVSVAPPPSSAHPPAAPAQAPHVSGDNAKSEEMPRATFGGSTRRRHPSAAPNPPAPNPPEPAQSTTPVAPSDGTDSIESNP